MTEDIKGQLKAVRMGLGDALQRLMKVEHLYTTGVAQVPEEMLQERDLIIEALNNQFELNLGFDCNEDDVPDTVAIFQQMVAVPAEGFDPGSNHYAKLRKKDVNDFTEVLSVVNLQVDWQNPGVNIQNIL